MTHTIDKNFFPGWVRKSLTFTIDDGDMKLDPKFISIVKPAGLKGTFNLCSNKFKLYPKEQWLSTYEGFAISNHCYYHPLALSDDRKRPIATEPFDPETADKEKLYPMEPHFYHIYTKYWAIVADLEGFLGAAKHCQEDLESYFGKGNVHGFVWPYGKQTLDGVWEGLVDMGFESIRKTGCTKDETGFALPSDRMNWSYNANYTCLLEMADAYDKYPDDGQLKYFCFGVHAFDFDRNEKWGDLIEFCNRMGNRPRDFWYSDVHSILHYEDAVKALIVGDTEIRNESDVELYLVVDGKKITLAPRSVYSLN